MQWPLNFQRKFSWNRARHRRATRLFRPPSVGGVIFSIRPKSLRRCLIGCSNNCLRDIEDGPQRKKTARVSAL